MNSLNNFYKEFTEQEMLTDIIPIGKTLLCGRAGCGKTYSIIKHLNENNIKPMLLDFDNNIKLDFDYYHLNGIKMLKKLMEQKNKPIVNDEFIDVDDKVLIIDTYSMVKKNFKDVETLYSLIASLIFAGANIIIVAHTDENHKISVEPEFANNCDAILHLRWDLSKKIDDVYLLIEKIRGYGGERKIVDWMR